MKSKALHATASLTLKAVQRKKTRSGRDVLVAPVVAMVEGVLTPHSPANQGILVEMQALEKTLASWSGKPVVINHPHGDTANEPDVFHAQTVGSVFNPRIENGKMHLDAHINVDDLKGLGHDKILQALESGTPTEVSIGAAADLLPLSGVRNGKLYKNILLSAKPDHLAILTDAKGACSVEGGCGIPLAFNCGCSRCQHKGVIHMTREEKIAAILKARALEGDLKEEVEDMSADALDLVLKAVSQDAEPEKEAEESEGGEPEKEAASADAPKASNTEERLQALEQTFKASAQQSAEQAATLVAKVFPHMTKDAAMSMAPKHLQAMALKAQELLGTGAARLVSPQTEETAKFVEGLKPVGPYTQMIQAAQQGEQHGK